MQHLEFQTLDFDTHGTRVSLRLEFRIQRNKGERKRKTKKKAELQRKKKNQSKAQIISKNGLTSGGELGNESADVL